MTDFETILRGVGLDVARAELDRAYDESGNYLARIWSARRDVPVDNHVTAILEAVDPELPAKLDAGTQASLLDAYATPALLVPPAVDDGALAALETLSRRGYRLAVVSNTMRTPGATLRKLLDKHGLLSCFEHVTFSDEIGIRKPDPEIFARALRALDTTADAAVHVGDDEMLDVLGARAAGMRVIQVTSTPLGKMGVRRPDAAIRHFDELVDAVARLDGG